MKKIFALLLPAAAIILMGAGCSLFGQKTANAPDGGVWLTKDAGDTWTQQAALPTSTGVSTIAAANIISFEIDPSDTTTYYAGSDANGLFYSTDNAVSWQRPKGEEAREGKILAVEVDPNNVCTVYVLKPDRLLRTTDCNRTYDSVLTEARSKEDLTALAIDWFNPSIIWAGNTAGDIMKSIDSGNTWTTVYRIRDTVTAIAVSNADSRIVLVGGEDKGLFRTIDGGASWTEYEEQLNKQFKESDVVYGFAQSRKGDTLLMNTKYGLIVSADQGASWSSLPIRTKAGDVRIWSIAVAPNDGKVIYYGTLNTLYVTVNSGESWAVKDLPSSTRRPMTISVHPSSSSAVFVGMSVPPED